MGNDFSPTRREREWLQEIQGWITRGDTPQMRAKLTEAAEDHALRPKFTAAALAYIIFAPHNKPAAKKRVEMIRAYLEHPGAPMPEAGQHPGLMARCLEKGYHGLLPPLHAAGLRAVGNRKNHQYAAQAIAKGKWPHADLVLPDLLLDEDAQRKIIDALFTGAVMKVERIEQLLQLSFDPSFTRKASRGLVRCMASKRHALDQANAGECVGRLLAGGMLDSDEVRKEALDYEDAIQERVERVMAQAQAWQLQGATTPASGRPRARL